MKLLIIDDDHAILEGLEAILELEHDVTTASTAAEALRAVDGRKYDAILLDLMMPDMDGVELKRRFDERGVCAPVLILSARHNAEDSARRAGAAGFLTKPFKVEELESMLGRFATA